MTDQTAGDTRLRALERAAEEESPALVRWINELRRREAFPASLEGLMEVHRRLAAEAQGVEDIIDRSHMEAEHLQIMSGKILPPCDWLLCAERPTRWYSFSFNQHVYTCERHIQQVEHILRRAQARRNSGSSSWTSGPVPEPKGWTSGPVPDPKSVAP